MSDIKQELDKIRGRISEPSFLKNEGLSNEVGIHVFCYDPADELIVRDFVSRLKAESGTPYHIKECDLYEIFLKLLEDKRVLKSVDGLEEKRGKEFVNKREAAKTATSLTELDAMITQLLNYKDTICRRMEVMSASRQQEAQKPTPEATAKPGTPAPKPPKIMTVRRYDLCSVKRLQSKEDIDKYVEAIREKLMKTLESCDGVQIN